MGDNPTPAQHDLWQRVEDAQHAYENEYRRHDLGDPALSESRQAYIDALSDFLTFLIHQAPARL